ncbi:MAG: exodeoxyribonuclease III [Desulfobacteraceae bacterium]|nr:MAG: exodeoxyribonuclease III [Desulfobacteraceae bacterium]
MKIGTFNTNSIRARLPIIIDWLGQERPDILCLQETKVQDKDFPADPFEAAGYQAFYRGQKSYNGVAIISKLPADEIRLGLYNRNEDEARFISGNINGISVINVYVPQGFAVGTEKFDYKLRWFRDLLSYVKGNYGPSDPLLLTGDFNVALEETDLYDPDNFRGAVCFHPDEQAIMREFFEWGFADIFRKHQPHGGHYTFWDYRIPNGFKRNMGWRIDYILATAPVAKKSQNAWIDSEPRKREKPSDHTFLVAEFNIDL